MAVHDDVLVALRIFKPIAAVLLTFAPYALAPARAQVPAAPKKEAPKLAPQSVKSSVSKPAAAPVKPSAGKLATVKAAPVKPAAVKQTASKTAGNDKTPARYRRPAQMQPSAQRYREIQQSLAEKGYFGGTVDGTWGTDSVDALKRFQRDQNLADDGKIGSLSLIALGLGAPHGAMPANPAANVPPTPPQQ